MKLYNKVGLVFLSLVFLFFVVCNAEAKTATKVVRPKPITKQFTRIFYCQNSKSALKSFSAHYNIVDVLAPQAYSIDSNGVLSGGVKPELLTVARKHNVKLMPLIVNKGFNSTTAHAFLDSEDKKITAIRALVAEAVKEKFWGWQVDFEQIDITYRDKFTAFVKQLTDALHEKNLISSVAVISQTSTNPGDYPKDYWYKFIGVYDYAGLASSTDFISLMSYDDPGSKGPATRYTWLKQVLNFALQSVPPEKLSVGIPLYYWRWNENTGKRVGTGTYEGIKNAQAKHYVSYGYGANEEAAYLKYTSKKVKYTIWYENGKSVQKKIDLIKSLGLHGFSAWALGQEVPSVYVSFAKNRYLFDPALAVGNNLTD